jgi:hypothetical protein
MSSNPNSFSSPDADSVPYTIDLSSSNPDGSSSPYILQTGDIVALTSTDGHSVVTPNPNDPTGATGSVSDTAGFDGPVTGALSFTPGAAAAAEGIVPVLGTWSGAFNPATKTLVISVAFGTPIAPAGGTAPATPAQAAARATALPAPHKT